MRFIYELNYFSSLSFQTIIFYKVFYSDSSWLNIFFCLVNYILKYWFLLPTIDNIKSECSKA